MGPLVVGCAVEPAAPAVEEGQRAPEAVVTASRPIRG
jgi:hypothetical protein